MTTGIRGDHLARLQGDLKRTRDRVYEIERRIKPDPANVKKREDITWYGSALPTTKLYPGRRVYAVALSNALFGPNSGKRLYVYGEAPIGQSGPAWRLVTPITYTTAFSGSSSSGSDHNAVSAYFGDAPCPVDATVTIHGSRIMVSPTRAEARISRTTSGGGTTPVSIAKRFFAPEVAGELTLVGTFHESRPTGADIAYGVQFSSANTVTWDTWHITITLT